MDGYDGTANAEAGPSRPRTRSRPPTRPVPDTPPATPPSTNKAKRRSWFGLGSPSVTPTPTAASKAKQQEEERQRRRSSTSSHRVEELELGSVIRPSTDQPPGFSNSVPRSEEGTARGLGEDELMTIDGNLESTVKKKKKRKSGGGPDPELDVMRMQDFGSKDHSRSVWDKTVRPHEFEQNAFPSPLKQPDLPPRTFSRTASERDTFISPAPTPRASNSSIDGRPSTQARQSSIPSTSPPNLHVHVDKSQPIIPVDVDRPLPPLPPGQASEFKVPEMPKGIVVTPSSPMKLTKTPRRPPDAKRRSRSATGRPREVVSDKRAQSSAPLTAIGLGLPSSLTPSSASSQSPSPSPSPSTDSSPPPPVPSKTQSVSSPLPSRSASPLPRIAFVEPEVPLSQSQNVDQPPAEKRHRVRRARSLSGIFGKSPVAQGLRGDESGGHTPESREIPLSESVGKTSGVLEWLGVRKTVKRKMSGADLKKVHAVNETDDGPVEHLMSDEKTHSGESLEPPFNGSQVSLSTQQTPRQQDVQSIRSTNSPSAGSSKLSSIFVRRASARNTDDESDPPSVKVAPVPIPNAGRRNQTAMSSESSFNLPPVDPISPFVPEHGPWMSSPQTEGEETLFSPGGSANWGPGVRPWMDGSERRNSSKSSINTPLDALPEQGLVHAQSPLKAPPAMREGRVRSWSDAPLPPQRVTSNSSNPHLPLPRPTTPGSSGQPGSLSASPKTPSRPKMGSRSNSGNAAILGRMKSVFSKSTNRSRSNSLLRQASSDIDEFGNIVMFGQGQPKVRPSTSSSSITSAVGARGRSVGDEAARPSLGPQIGDDAKERAPRTSYTPSMASLGSTFRQSTLSDPPQNETKGARRNRVRASTVSLAPTSYNFVPPSPNIFPTAATPPRRRPGTIHRLSNGLFGSGPSSPRSSSLFPLPPRSSGSISSSVTTAPQWEESSTGFLSPGTSPRPSTGSISAAMSNAAVKQASVREEEETPRQWLERVVASVGRQDIANVLATSGDEFHTEALQLYMATFDFTHNALDVALRRLLMHMSLPKETQQIDRVIEAFAQRYEQCEPGLFGAKDNTYVLAFSMMMLHTDAFNKHNKNKMTKPDYVRNTRMDGVSPLVLEAFFDNITYTSFVFIEDDTDLKRSSGYESSSSTFGPSTPTFAGPLNAPNPPGKSKIDVYHMIVRGLLSTLRVDVERQIPAESPFSCFGTRPVIDLDVMGRAFANAHSLVIPASSTDRHRKVPGKLTTPTRRHTGGEHRLDHAREAEMVLRVTKVGLLSRKDDAGDLSKKASRKWKSWSVILTGSQLLFFKDPTWALTLLEQAWATEGTDKAGQLLLPKQTAFKPDEVFPVKDCIAVFDKSYTACPNTFRFVMPQSRQYLLQASDEYEMNEWINLINYASAFKTANLKMKSLGSTMRKDQVVLAGAAAAASHKRELRGGGSQTSLGSASRKAVFGESNGLGLSEQKDGPSTPSTNGVGYPFGSSAGPANGTDTASTSTTTLMSTSAPLQSHLPNVHVNVHLPKVRSKTNMTDVVVDEVTDDTHETEQLEEVFGVVKAELAAGRGEAGGINAPNPTLPIRTSVESDQKDGSPVKEVIERKRAPVHTSRVAQIYDHLRRLREAAAPLESSLESSLLIARNIALLTPFQKSTRDRLSSSISPIAYRIRSDRLALAKLRLWIRVLEHEGEREDREWKVVRHVALQAAARSLREDGVKGVVRDVNLELQSKGKGKVPKLALPANDDGQPDPHDDHDQEPDQEQEREQETEEGGEENGRDGVSPVELPVNFRRPSEENQHQLQSGVRPQPGGRSSSGSGSGSSRRPSTSEAISPSGSRDRLNPGQLRRVTSTNDLLSPRYQSRRSSEEARVHDHEHERSSNHLQGTSKRSASTSTSSLAKIGVRANGVTDNEGSPDEDREKEKDLVTSGRATPIVMFHMESPLDMDSEAETTSPFVPSTSASASANSTSSLAPSIPEPNRPRSGKGPEPHATPTGDVRGHGVDIQSQSDDHDHDDHRDRESTTLNARNGHPEGLDRADADEEGQEWALTRAAKRMSLVFSGGAK